MMIAQPQLPMTLCTFSSSQNNGSAMMVSLP